MPFWSEDFGANPALKDPKRKFRFTVEFQGIDSSQGGATLWYAKTVNKPGFTIAAAEHKYLNHTFYYPGSVAWQDVTVTLVDPVDPDMAATLSDIVVAGGYTPPTTANSLTSMSKARASSALGTVYIQQIDSNGSPIETWTLWNAFITELKFGDLAYGEDDLNELSVTLKYDWARVETTTPSVAVNGSQGSEFFQV
tara:strand:+ start:255 stop:842 length:588 start_codon:yes stop_codon:yes gene_type:complete